MRPDPRPVIMAFLLCFSLIGNAQTSFTDKIPNWKTKFPKEDVVANIFKETVDFSLNPAPKEGEAKVRATLSSETVIVPLKDYLKYEDDVVLEQSKLFKVQAQKWQTLVKLNVIYGNNIEEVVK